MTVRAVLCCLIFLQAVSSAVAGEKSSFDVEGLVQKIRTDVEEIPFRNHQLARMELASVTARLGLKKLADEDFEKSYQMVVSWSEQKDIDDGLAQIVRFQAEGRNLEAAVRALKKIKNDEVRKSAVRQIFRMAYGAFEYDAIQDFIEKTSENGEERDAQLKELAWRCAWNEKFEKAVEVSRRIKSPEILERARCLIGIEAATVGKIPLALEMAKDNPRPDLAILWMFVCAARAKSGNLAEARRDFEQARRLMSRPEHLIRRTSYFTALVALGEINEALQIARKSGEEYEVSDLAEVLAKAGKYTRAIELSRELRESHDRVWLLMQISRFQFEAGDAVAARNTLAELPTIPKYREADLVEMAYAHFTVGDRARAALRVREALEIALAIPEEDQRPDHTDTLCAIAQLQGKLKFVAGAASTLRIAREKAMKALRGSSQKDRVQSVARCQTEVLGPEQVSEWVAKLEDPEVRAYGRIGILQGLRERQERVDEPKGRDVKQVK